MPFIISALIILIKFSTTQCLLSANGTYGKDWMYFPNGEGKIEVALLRPPENQVNQFERNENYELIRNNLMDIEFELYTSKNPMFPKVYTNDQRTLRNLKNSFNPKLETKFIIHGWRSSTKSDIVQTIKNAYLQKGLYNVFGVNWEKRASNILYPVPARDTPYVGKAIAAFVDYLIKVESAKPEDIHLIGHSLGAHVIGFAGSYTSKGRLGRLTGLDPAFPGFGIIAGPESRLDPTDAEFVDVIHTSGGLIAYDGPLGHVDFYPNGGRPVQPGCDSVLGIIDGCSHGRAYEYYRESISTDIGFLAYPCPSWDNYVNGDCGKGAAIQMGHATNMTARGKYYLSTRSSAPFAMGYT